MNMLDHELVAVARGIAIGAHAGQTDQAGHPYIEHCSRVAQKARRIAYGIDKAPEDLDRRIDALNVFEVIAVAWLHDVLEDTPVTAEMLDEAGISNEVVAAVLLLTHISGEPRDQYYARIRENPLARVVKLADVADNSDPERLALLDHDTNLRLAIKYNKARAALS